MFEDLVDAKRILREIKLLLHFKQNGGHQNVVAMRDIMCGSRSSRLFEDCYIVLDKYECVKNRISLLKCCLHWFYLFKVTRDIVRLVVIHEVFVVCILCLHLIQYIFMVNRAIIAINTITYFNNVLLCFAFYLHLKIYQM